MPGTTTETATLGGGCFWCLEAVFEELEGVESVVNGYSGGQAPDPTYEDVCTGETGHAEVARVEFDPGRISYRELLEVYFSIHDPTQLNRQGGDVGTQYRSVILHHSQEQKATAEAVIEELSRARLWPGRIVTRVEPFKEFYRAEDYHQHYFRRNPTQGYCRAIVAPKVAKFRQKWAQRLKATSPA